MVPAKFSAPVALSERRTFRKTPWSDVLRQPSAASVKPPHLISFQPRMECELMGSGARTRWMGRYLLGPCSFSSELRDLKSSR